MWHTLRVTLFPIALALALATRVGSGAEPAPQLASINSSDLRVDVLALTSEEMSGRLLGTAGNQRAVEFIATRFEALGLSPRGDNGSFLRQFGLVTTTLGNQNKLMLTVADSSQAGRLGTDFYPVSHSGTSRATGSVVFVGFGLVAPPLEHDDYRDIDVAGRVVVMLEHEPAEYDPDSRFAGVARSEYARDVRKTLEAQRRGAAAVILVPDVHSHRTDSSLEAAMQRTWPTSPPAVPRTELSAWVSQVKIPVVRVSTDFAERLLGVDDGESLALTTERAENPGGVHPFERSGVHVELVTDVRRQTAHHPNVVGAVEGSDPSVRSEWVLVCAHLDHDGVTPSGLFPGADDNASGIAGLMAVAKAFTDAARVGQTPRRSVLFAAWNGEERGLLGSWAYAEHPVVSLERTVAVLNMDMIGRHEEVPERGGRRFRGLEPQTSASNTHAVNLLGYSYSPDLRRVAEAADQVAETELALRFRYDDNPSDLLRRSDHWPFLFNGVPALFVHTGLHPDYHTERDTADLLDYDKMTRIVRLVHQMTWDLAEAPTRPDILDRPWLTAPGSGRAAPLRRYK